MRADARASVAPGQQAGEAAGFVWDERYLTGIDEVDGEHRALIRIIERLAAAGRTQPERAAIGSLLEQLRECADRHFATEERLMAEAGCARRHVLAHKREHRDFARHLTRFGRWLEDDPRSAAAPMLGFASDWLTHHILHVDKSMARQIAAIAHGMSPDDAYRSEQRADADSAEALLATVHRLYAELGTYTARLREHNEELRCREAELGRTREELARINRELEQRVAQRTRELAQANAALTHERDALAESRRRLEDAQAQLLQSEKMASIGQLAAGIAHEINNPIGFVGSNLGTLAGYVDRLLSLIAEYERMQAGACIAPEQAAAIEAARARADLDYLRQDIVELVAESRAGLDRVRKIIRDLRDFSHADESLWQDADLHAGIESTLNVVWNELKYKADVIREFGELPPVPCAPGQINQVVMNLLVNAAQAIEDRGTIRVRTGTRAGWAFVEVVDTGAGMTAEVRRHMFEPFYTTKPVGKGTGLGLSVSYNIVARHGGRIEVESEPGRGTTMRVLLPLVRRATAPEREAQAAAA